MVERADMATSTPCFKFYEPRLRTPRLLRTEIFWMSLETAHLKAAVDYEIYWISDGDCAHGDAKGLKHQSPELTAAFCLPALAIGLPVPVARIFPNLLIT